MKSDISVLVVILAGLALVGFMVYDTALEADQAVEYLKWTVTAYVGGKALNRE